MIRCISLKGNDIGKDANEVDEQWRVKMGSGRCHRRICLKYTIM